MDQVKYYYPSTHTHIKSFEIFDFSSETKLPKRKKENNHRAKHSTYPQFEAISRFEANVESFMYAFIAIYERMNLNLMGSCQKVENSRT